ncbi:trans-1,2-dihydrobenzene-1,2-diol dehydrogenase-like [Bradysia coprophila]|uniref:trans-1,2-dihydrobenzene-1,2-diol dehydrogenase-like n=1 Tax=Bradysia coprophila TaxID=38358 RepID=UPI00187DD8D0|nr:trans-1,2-dihydrobenzene-1,2-diol dehydrogenase-like [Bradysia coprophila]
MALKWGIASAGKIAHDFVNALGTLSEDEHQVVAVGARDLNRSKEFAQRFGIPKAYGSYVELAKDPNVEVVHIGMYNIHHMEVALLMLEHGKHVLVEKPMGMNGKQVQKIFSYAKQKNLFAMEGIWSRSFPCYEYIRKQIDGGKLGDIVSVQVDFGAEGLKNEERFIKKSLGGGSVLEVGVYPIQFAQFIFRSEPKSIKANGTLNADGIDLDMYAELSYGGNKVAKISATGIASPINTATIIGTKGTMTIPSFWCPTSLIDVDGSEKTWPLPKAKLEFNFTNSAGLRFEADEVRKCIRAGKMESDKVSHNESLIIARIEDEIRKQIGVKYSQDD